MARAVRLGTPGRQEGATGRRTGSQQDGPMKGWGGQLDSTDSTRLDSTRLASLGSAQLSLGQTRPGAAGRDAAGRARGTTPPRPSSRPGRQAPDARQRWDVDARAAHQGLQVVAPFEAGHDPALGMPVGDRHQALGRSTRSRLPPSPAAPVVLAVSVKPGGDEDHLRAEGFQPRPPDLLDERPDVGALRRQGQGG